MSKRKKWILSDIDTSNALRISEQLNVSLLAAKILCARGFGYEDAKKFLNAEDDVFHNPFLLNDMQKAVDRINSALLQKEKIAVYGDYDVDGITATYIVYDYLKTKGADVIYYIPDRLTEGYGINTRAIDTLSAAGVNLIVTVDVGITAFKETEYAKNAGIDMVITDHHSLKDELPAAIAVVNPKITDASYPFDALAGVGVAFKLVYALSGLDKKIFDNYCDIAAIGTIADMVPLKDENRYIAACGIEKLKTTDNKGIRAIMQVAGLSLEDISSSDISFGIAPRINAAGRMADASKSVELLLQKDRKQALSIAEELDRFNHQRQKEEQKIYDEALEIIKNKSYENNAFILVGKEGWAHGIIGIVSSKLTEKFYKPSAVVSINPNGTGKASGRSIKGINLFDVLSNCKENLAKFGGHELAAGFTIKENKLNEFREEINKYVSSLLTEDIAAPTLSIDCKIELCDITLDNARSLERLEPYGIGNNIPMLCVDNVKISSIRYTQNKKHAFITVTDGATSRELPAFSMGDNLKHYTTGEYINVAGTLGINNFKGKIHPQFIIRDIHSSPKNKCVSRGELALIFTDIKGKISKGIHLFDKKVSLNVNYRKKMSISSPKIQTALTIFTELNILDIKETEEGLIINEGFNFKNKSELNNSKTFVLYNSENII